MQIAIGKSCIKELTKISEPVINFIKENYNPHTTIIISEDSIKVVTDEMNIPLINQFWLQDKKGIEQVNNGVYNQY